MISPSSVQAVISSSSGRVSRAHRQAVVARGGERVRQAGEDALAGVVDRAGLAVHQALGADHLAAHGLADRLVAEADAEDRQVVRRARRSAPGRCRLRSGVQGPGDSTTASGRSASASCAVSASLRWTTRLRAQLVQVVDEVVGEAVVVIDDQDHAAAFRKRAFRRTPVARQARHLPDERLRAQTGARWLIPRSTPSACAKPARCSPRRRRARKASAVSPPRPRSSRSARWRSPPPW